MPDSGKLKIVKIFQQAQNTIIIHPNDGFDLGMMTLEYEVDIYWNADEQAFAAGSIKAEKGKIILKNQCPQGTINLSKKDVDKIKDAVYITLSYSEPNLLVKTSE